MQETETTSPSMEGERPTPAEIPIPEPEPPVASLTEVLEEESVAQLLESNEGLRMDAENPDSENSHLVGQDDEDSDEEEDEDMSSEISEGVDLQVCSYLMEIFMSINFS